MNQRVQDYSVNYTINVEASQGVENVNRFAESVSKLTQARTNLSGAVTNIKNMMDEIDRAFRTKAGKKRDYSYKFNIDTQNTETKLKRVQALLVDISDKCKNVNLVLNTGKPLNSQAIKAQAKTLIDQKATGNKDVTHAANQFIETQKKITKSIGKINSGLITLEKGRKLNIQTEEAKAKLQEILSLTERVKSSVSKVVRFPLHSASSYTAGQLKYVPLNSRAPFVMSNAANYKLQEKLYSSRQLGQQRLVQQRLEAEAKEQRRSATEAARRVEREKAQLLRQQEAISKKTLADQQRQERETQKRQQASAAEAIRNTQRQIGFENSVYGNKRRAAVNRLQYSKKPTLRNLPLAYMFNAYMGYHLMKTELTKAVEYSNIMQTAHSILKVADNDLATFENRFGQMARYVRQVGVETKFTAIEVAGAVKYLSMAGMGIETINRSIRPITNLALIGDNDISQIADLATNIMAGYNIKSISMPSVADILASTVSRSNVNIIEMAESYKMAAGYMKLAGVDFTESAAAIGILGNMGIKGTMAGTSLRAMATRFAKPTKEAQKTLDRLNIRFTEYRDVYGKQVEKLRSLPDIFEDLKSKGATMADMQTIFGRIGGNAAMMFLNNYDKLRELSSHNKASQGISDELAKIKQETTKGMWYQVTSQFSESFMQSFELLEPKVKSLLRGFLQKFNAPEFSRGIASIGTVLLDLLSVLSNIATWFTRNFNWIEPILFTGIVGTRLFKLAGAITNVGVALGFLGKQAVATSSINLISGLFGGGFGRMKSLTFANKRAIVSAMSAAGVSGKGAMQAALASYGVYGGMNTRIAGGTASGLFASQVATGNGLVGAGASISALGAGAVAASAGIAALVGAMGWLAYKTWKVKEAKDAVLEEIETNRKYRYPSIESLYDSLHKTYTKAIDAKAAVDELTGDKTIQDESGQKIGAFTANWWAGILGAMGSGSRYGNTSPIYTTKDAYQEDAAEALTTLAKKDSQSRVYSAFAELGKLTKGWEVDAFMQTIQTKYGQDTSKLDTALFDIGKDSKVRYKKGIENLAAAEAYKTWHYSNYHNTVTVPEIQRATEVYRNAITNYEGARDLLEKAGFSFSALEEKGFYRDQNGIWTQKKPGSAASDKERSDALATEIDIRDQLVKLTSSLRKTFGGSSEAAENIMRIAGFSPRLFSNEPSFNDETPFNANDITNNRLHDADDGMAGGNYSGTGKLSSAAPKQVIVNITNLLSVETIDLMKSKEGQVEEIQNLKEQMAQALIDVVHDFDASWNT